MPFHFSFFLCISNAYSTESTYSGINITSKTQEEILDRSNLEDTMGWDYYAWDIVNGQKPVLEDAGTNLSPNILINNSTSSALGFTTGTNNISSMRLTTTKTTTASETVKATTTFATLGLNASQYLIETTKLDPYIKSLNIGDRIYLDKLNYYFISNVEKENFSDNYKDTFYKKLKLN